MLGLSTSRDGLFQLSDEALASLVHKEPILDFYEVDETPLGKGKYSAVYRAVHRQSGGQFAAKFLKKQLENEDQMKEIIHEVAVMMQCDRSERVIRLHHVHESPTEMVLVLELAAGGDLQRVLDDGQCLCEREARKSVKRILDGVAFLHHKNIVHLDLKPQNVLLALEDDFDSAKLCDFGVSKVLEAGVKVRAILGTVDYVAPEVLNYEPVCLATDIWSIGVLLYVLLSGHTPFGADDKQQTFLKISQRALFFEPDQFEGVSDLAKDFIQSALVADPRERPSVQDLLGHPWVSSRVGPPLDSMAKSGSANSISANEGGIACLTTTGLEAGNFTEKDQKYA